MFKTSLTLTDRQLCDLELLLNGGFAPLNGFMNQKDYDSVLNEMRLSNGSIWTIPINLDISKDFAERINHNEKILLKDKEGFSLAILTITDIWEPNLKNESKKIYNTTDLTHPGVNYLINKTNRFYLGGLLEKISDPKHYDYKEYRHTPRQLRDVFKKLKWKKVIAFQTRNPLHRAHVEMIKNAIKNENANLLLHPVVGMTKPGDVNHYTRLRCYQSVLKRFDQKQAILSLIPLAMRMAGPREAVWHALIRKNYGCSHLIVGRDHAGPGLAESGKPFYGPYDAQELLIQHQNEIGIEMIPFKFMVFLPNLKSYKPIDEVKKGENHKTISGTELRNILDNGQKIPSWFTYPEVAKELERSIPPLNKRGITIFFTGLSGSGKSTLANGLMVKLLEEGSRTVTLLDGDIVRTHLSNELGFSKEHRSINVQRIGYVASEITKNKGIAICAPIAPYEIDRKINRDLISSYGGYIEIFVNTPLEKCEERDSKGLYKLARKGIIKEFTGISDPYEKPLNPEIIIDSSNQNPEELVDVLYNKIQKLGYLK
jgi:sulfate adenylyltransferase